MPFSMAHKVDHPASLYAASQKANELMAHSYSHLFDLPNSGLRYFTLYGPWGLPDLAPWLFTSANHQTVEQMTFIAMLEQALAAGR